MGFPEADAVGQAIAAVRAGEQIEKEILVALVERTQALGDDLDCGRSRPSLAGGVRGGTSGGVSFSVSLRPPVTVDFSASGASGEQNCRKSSAKSLAVV